MPKDISKETKAVTDKLRSTIELFRPGEKLPSVRTLLAEYRCSRQVLKKALEKLKAEGICKAVPREGLFAVKSTSAVRRVHMLRIDWISSQAKMISEEIANEIKRIPNCVYTEYHYKYNDVDAGLDMLKKYSCDLAVLWLEEIAPTTLLKLLAIDIPLLFFGSGNFIKGMIGVDLPEEMLGMTAAHALMKRGHTRIALLRTEPKGWIERRIVAGFCGMLEVNSLKPQVIDCNIVRGESSIERSVDILEEYFSQHDLDFTGVFLLSGVTSRLANFFASRMPENGTFDLIGCGDKSRVKDWEYATFPKGFRVSTVYFEAKQVAQNLIQAIQLRLERKPLPAVNCSAKLYSEGPQKE